MRKEVIYGLMIFLISTSIQQTRVETIPLNDLTVEGKPVDYVFFLGDPLVVSHAGYRLENGASHPRICNVRSSHFVENDTAIPLSAFQVYAGNVLLEKAITIPPASTLNIRVTFPFREVHVGIHFRYTVALNLECDGQQYNVISKLNIIQEKR